MAASVQHAKLMTRTGQAAAAIPLLADALKKHLAQPANQQDLNDEFEYRFAVGRALLAANRAQEALLHLERALVLRQTQYAHSPKLAEAQIVLAQCKLSLGDATAARVLHRQAQAIQSANKELADYFRTPLAELGAALAKTSAG
jgi:ATP/maltotriose-dependent transcriptional regulator MalT